MFTVRLGVPVVAALLLAGGWLMGEDPKKPADPKDPVVPVRGTLPANWKKLGLTDTQTREVYRIRGTYAAKIDVLKRQIAELVGEEKVELEKVLTDAQKARLKELKLGEPTKPKDPGESKDKPGEKPAETTAKKEKTEDKK
jgi:hypothetical protein